MLDDWQDVLLLHTKLVESDINKTSHSLQFTFDEVEIDLLAAINFDTKMENQQRMVMDHIKNSPDPKATSGHMSAELTELALSFMKSKSKFCHDIAR